MDPTLQASRGSRTLVATLDSYARKEPDKIFSCVHVPSDLGGGFRDVTFRDIAHAVDAFAWWLENTYGRSNSFETIAYIGVNDLRYAIVLYAAIKAGYKAFLLRTSNSSAQIHRLLEQTACTKLFFSQEYQGIIEQVLSVNSDLAIELVEPLLYWTASYTKPYSYETSFDSAKDNPVVVLQPADGIRDATPVTLSNSYFTAADIPYPDIPGREIGLTPLFNLPGGGYYFCPEPASELSGFFCTCVFPLFSFSGCGVLAPLNTETDTTPDFVQYILEWKDVKLLFADAALIEGIAEISGGMHTLRKLNCLIYYRGQLSEEYGENLAKHGVRITPAFGSIDTGWAPFIVPHTEDWEYIEFYPNFSVKMEPVMDGDVCELVFPASDATDETRLQKAQRPGGIGCRFAAHGEHRTQVVFTQHPLKSELWKYYSRLDDFISSRSTINALDIESSLLSNAEI